MVDRFKRILKKYLLLEKSSNYSPEELQAAFRSRYRHFRALLTANNNALEAMAEMELALHAGRSYSMAFIRTRTTTVMVNVYKMVQHMIELSEGRYHRLEKSYEKIRKHVEAIVEKQTIPLTGELLIPLTKINKNMADQVGEKMANLGEVATIPGLNTPRGFAVTASATRLFFSANTLQREINRLLQLLDPNDLESLYQKSSEIQKLVVNGSVPPDLEKQILTQYKLLEGEAAPGIKVAIRSSALGEDLVGASFAGQYHSELNVDMEFLGQAFKEVVAGKYTARAIMYRLTRGYSDDDVKMCVGFLAMVDAVISGVVYSRDPTFFHSSWVTINVVSGSALHVVDGSEITDHFRVGREEPHRILEKNIRRSPGNNRRELQQNSSDYAKGTTEPGFITLTNEQARKLTQAAVTLEEHFGFPQDIEWSIDPQGKLVILQSRPLLPLTAEEKRGDSSGINGEEKGVVLQGGVTGSVGIACGPVFKVCSTANMLQFPHDAVLVVEHPLSEWAPLLSRSVALIAETGSEAGHLATVSRELGLPALLAVPDATSKLQNGEVVTVDASGCRVYSGRRDAMLSNALQPPDLMAGSPVERTLQEVLQFITPLNLTDPGSPYFKSSWCETMHDITRFCHEKSVAEMFSFGERHHFDERAAKRLVADVPMEWWVIDLAEGFREGVDVKGQTIHMDDIVSIPMLAIWEGMMAFPWEGPPPVSARGMGAILFESTMQPGLVPAVASPMASKNYFLISKNFCNLSVRLGYHFAMVEAYLSGLRTERYVNFTFKGGAANEQRKVARVELLAEILNHFEFRIEKKGDSLTARVEKRPMEFLQERLRILGYLTLHTRQIDMIMGTRGAIQQYKEKFLSEINTILARPKSTL